MMRKLSRAETDQRLSEIASGVTRKSDIDDRECLRREFISAMAAKLSVSEPNTEAWLMSEDGQSYMQAQQDWLLTQGVW